MNKCAILSSLILLCFSLKSQSPIWTKDDRNNLYDDCVNYTTKYRNVSNEQKESLCLCYLEEITKKYAKGDFEAKIDIEVKRIKEAVLTQCAKNIGVELASASKQIEQPEKNTEPIKPSSTSLRDLLIGKWKTDNSIVIEFKSDGTFIKTFQFRFVTQNYGHIEDNKSKGDWFLDEAGTLTLNEKWVEDIGNRRVKLQGYVGTGTYKFISFGENFIKYKFIDGAYSENIANEDEKEIIQANRIKE